ncbi:MAG: hypothetical protein AAFO29_14525, partial [Actinomycetota bacterium]
QPLKPQVVSGPIVIGCIGLILALISMFSSWIVDARGDTIITPELQAQIDEIRQQAADGEIDSASASSEILVLRATAETADKIVIDGKSGDGPQLGLWSLIFAGLGAAGAAVSAGAAGLDDRRQWLGGALAMGCGVGISLLAVGWIGSLARAGDPNYFSGVGSMVGLISGMLVFVAGSTVVAGYERSKIYVDLTLEDTAEAEEPEPISQPVPDPV